MSGEFKEETATSSWPRSSLTFVLKLIFGRAVPGGDSKKGRNAGVCEFLLDLFEFLLGFLAGQTAEACSSSFWAHTNLEVECCVEINSEDRDHDGG